MSDYLPQDFVSQILKYLPVKSLLRCVCKWWRQVIDSSDFTKEHLALQNPRILVGYQNQPEFFVVAPHNLPLMDTLRVDTLRVPIVFNNEQFKLIGTLHGVFCFFDNAGDVWLWNPSIRKVSRLQLPKFRFFDLLNNARERGLLSTGFWIDPSTKNFKFIVFHPSPYHWDPVLYSSVERVWKLIPLPRIENWVLVLLGGGPAIVIGTVAYWRALIEFTGDEKNESRIVVLSFDFVIGAFDLIETPQRHDGARLILEKWHDTLSVAFEDIMINSDCNIYLRQEGLWVHMLHFSMEYTILCIIWVMAGSEERENIRILATTTDKDLVLGDSRAGWVDVKNGIQDPFGVDVVYDFVESLLFP